MENNNFDKNNQNNPQTGYTQSGQPYGYSQQSGNPYPPSTNPYYTTGYVPPKKKSNTTQVAIISVIAVLIVALATILIVLLRGNMGMQPPPPPPMNMMVIPGTVMLNGQEVTFDIIDKDNRTYLPVEDFIQAVGYECVVDNGKIKIVAPTELVTLEIDSTKVEIKDQTTGITTNVNITTAPFETEGKAYIYAKDIVLFLSNATVTYNTQMDTVQINVGMAPPPPPPPGGGYMPPPPPYGGPGGYAPPQGGQPQGGPGGPGGQQPPAGGPGEQPQKQ